MPLNVLQSGMAEQPVPNREYFLKLARTRMPFGKHAGQLLIDLPEEYLIWFRVKGFPLGQLGSMMEAVLEIKMNGLEHLFDPLREKR